MNILIICATIVACVYIICYYINKLTCISIEHDDFVNSMSNDIDSIKDIVDRTIAIDLYNDTVKNNLLSIKQVISKYDEESENADNNTKES